MRALDVKRISLPRMLPAAAIHGLRAALVVMRDAVDTGVPADRSDPRVGIEDIMELMEYTEMRAPEKRLTTLNN